MAEFVRKARQSYFHSATPIVSDADFDAVVAELRTVCPSHPVLTEVGAPVPFSGAGTVLHKHPMGSLANSMNEAELRQWLQSISETTGVDVFSLFANFKMDGGSVAINYEAGKLKSAATRGDGDAGEDITANAATFAGVPTTVMFNGSPVTGSVRGEVVLTKPAWRIVDPEGASNPRNLGNGIMRRHDGTMSAHLTFYAFRVFDSQGQPFGATEEEVIKNAVSMGFTVAAGSVYKSDGSDGLFDLYRAYDQTGEDSPRALLPFEIDGLVLKVNDIATQRKFYGDVDGCPWGQRAVKFAPSGAETVVKDITVQLGVTGRLTPVAELEPVEVGGVSIKRASLHNWEEIRRLGLCIGDTVRVVRAADVIPQVVAVTKRGDTRQEFPEPTKCPETGLPTGHLELIDGAMSTDLYVIGAEDSDPIRIMRIYRWLNLTDIKGIGEVLVGELYTAGLVKSPGELYTLESRGVTHVTGSNGVVAGESSMRKLYKEIEAKRVVPINVALAAIGIKGLGRRNVEKWIKDSPALNNMDVWKDKDRLQDAVKDLGKSAVKISKEASERISFIADLESCGVIIEPLKAKVAKPAGPCFCITGDAPGGKGVWHQQIEDSGYQWAGSYTKAVTHVITQFPNVMTVKLKKARADGKPVWGFAELKEFLGQNV
jgi:DNA ligase (NAD+)